jgi:hypothetical protein
MILMILTILTMTYEKIDDSSLPYTAMLMNFILHLYTKSMMIFKHYIHTYYAPCNFDAYFIKYVSSPDQEYHLNVIR